MKVQKKSTILLSLLAASSSQGALLLSETFDGLTTGGLNVQNGWTALTGVNVVTGGLSYSAGTINVAGGTKHVQSSVGGTVADANATKGFATQSGNVWYSFTMKITGSVNNDRYWFGIGEEVSITSGFTGSFGDTNTGNKNVFAETRINTTPVNSATSLPQTLDQIYFIVARLSKDGAATNTNAYDSMEIWIDPTSETLGTASLTTDRTNSTTEAGIDTFALTVLGTPGLQWDNLRIGNAKADVVDFYVIPEPSSAVLLGFGALGLVLRRSRKG